LEAVVAVAAVVAVDDETGAVLEAFAVLFPAAELVTCAETLLKPDELVFTAEEDEPVEAGAADELGVLEVLARTADVEAGEVVDAGARLEVTQEQTASAEV
jgi:hypothetical protein